MKMEKTKPKNGKDEVLSEDRDSNDRSLKMLAKRLKPRSFQIHHITFGHKTRFRRRRTGQVFRGAN